MNIRIALSSVLGSMVICSSLAAQDVSSKIAGVVHDPSGAVVAGALVTAHETARGVDYTAKTNADGFYYLSPLPIGNYTLRVEAPGFAATQRAGFDLAMDQTARVDIGLSVGTTAQVVEVTSAPPLLQTDQTFLGTVLDARANVTLPLATRNYNQLTLLSPGAVSLNPGAFTGSQASFQVGRPYINGNREQTNNYILDGMDNNQIDNNDVAFSPSVDAIEEFNLISQNAPASYGNYLGGIISVTIKSGTNHVHGDIFEFIRNDALNANTWANGLARGTSGGVVGPKPVLRWNEFGGTLGGPILRNKLFLFGDYQGSRYDQPATSNLYTVFTTAERRGDFSALCTAGFNAQGLCTNPAQQLYNPFSASTPGGRTPFPNNRVNVPFSPAASKILSSPLYPGPLNADLTQNQVNITHSYTNSDQGDVKLDFAASQRDHFTTRYSQQHIVNPTTSSQLLNGNSENQFPLYNGVLDYARNFSSSFLNDARIGASYFPVTEGYTNTAGQNLPANFGIAGTSPDQTFLPLMTFQGGNSNGPSIGNNNLISEFHDTVVEAEDTVTLIRGKHSLNVGFEYFGYRTNVLYVGNSGLAGQFIFDGSFTGNPAVIIRSANGTTSSPAGMAEADFLLGLPENVGLGSGSGKSLRNSLYSGFAQDNWHVSNNLTLNLGLRYEVVTPRAEAHDQATNYGLYTGTVEIAGVNGASKALYNQYNGPTNFQPRFGFAFQPESDRAMVIRGAYGISNFTESTGTGNLLIQNPPFAIPRNVTYSGATQALPTTTLDQGFSTFPAAGCTVAAALAASPKCFAGTGIHAFDPNGTRPAVSQQYNLTVQHQLGSASTFQVSYVGQKTDHLMTIALINQQVLGPNGVLSPSPYLNPTLQAEIGQARLTASTGYSNYNSLQTSFQRRLSQGLEFQANYTFAKCLGNSSGFFAQYGDTNAGLTQAGNNHFFFQDTYHPERDYGRCDQNVKHSFSGFFTYDLPFGRGRTFGAHLNRAADLAFGGWQVNSILQFHTGFPITAQGANHSGTITGFSRADCSGPPVETPYKRFPNASYPGYQWLDPSSVSNATAGTFGNCQVGSFTGPGLQDVDASVGKSFTTFEHQSLQFRAEAINVINHPILVAPNSFVGTTFGLVNNAQGERNLQFGLKYQF